jgi:hypothetical protein
MRALRFLLLMFALVNSGAFFAQNVNQLSESADKKIEIIVADYNHMNLGPKLMHLPKISITSITDRTNTGNINAADFISNWMLYQTDVKKMSYAIYQSADSATRAEYDNTNSFIYQNELPTVIEILAFCKK